MEFNPAQARRNIIIEFVDKDFSKFSVFPVVVSFFLDYLHLDKLFKGVLKPKRSNHSFSGTEYLLTLMSIIFLGIKRLYKADDLLADERQLAKILGIRKERFPSSTRLYRLLAGVDHWEVRRLDKVNLAVIKRHKEYLANRRWLVADIDQTNKLTEGLKIERAKPCYDRKRKGKLGLRLSTAQVEGVAFSQKLEPGNTGNAEAFPFLFKDMLSKLDKISSPLQKKRVRNKKIILRIDGGYFSTETLNLLEEVRKRRRLGFVIKAKNNLKLIQEAKAETKPEDWQKIDDRISVLRLSNQPVLKGIEAEYVVLIIRDKQKRVRSKKKRVYHLTKTIEYVLVTTLSSWRTARIIKFYRKRQQIENLFKEFNQSFKADKLPSHRFWGNAFYFNLIGLVSNCTLFLKKHSLPKNTRMPLWKLSETDLSTSLAR